MPACNASVAERRKERLFVLKSELLGEPFDLPLILQGGKIELIAMQIVIENLPAQLQAALALLGFEPDANLRFSARRFDPFEPLAARRLLRRRDDLDRIAAA